jgi:hypothetical protein
MRRKTPAGFGRGFFVVGGAENWFDGFFVEGKSRVCYANQ